MFDSVSSTLMMSPCHRYLDVKLQVLVHGVDVVEDVSGDTRDDPHQLRVVQVPLKNVRSFM